MYYQDQFRLFLQTEFFYTIGSLVVVAVVKHCGTCHRSLSPNMSQHAKKRWENYYDRLTDMFKRMVTTITSN